MFRIPKYTRMTSGCFVVVAGFIACGFMSSYAAAAPIWEVQVAGKFEAVVAALAVESEGTGMEFIDNKIPLTIMCNLTDKGTVNAAGKDEITEVALANCKSNNVAACPNVEKMEVINLPWKSELFEPVGGEIRDKIFNAGKNIGWKVVCKGGVADSCTGETSALTINNGGTGNVELEFEANSPKLFCTVGKNGAGEIKGKDVIKHPAGTEKLRV